MSVLASVIGHSKAGRSLFLDAGALALSKDLGAHKYMPEAGYGLVCDPVTAKPLPGLAVATVHQEHGTVPVDDSAWFERLPVGSLVRVIPNHACITCAAYDAYTVVRGVEVVGQVAASQRLVIRPAATDAGRCRGSMTPVALLVENDRPVLVALGDVAGDVGLPAPLNAGVVVEVELAADDPPGERVALGRVAL